MKKKESPLEVIIVDDSGEFRSLLKSHLRHMGARVVCEASSANHLEENIAKNNPDILFLDINMPGSSGLEVLPSVKQAFPGLFIVVITGDSSEDIVKGALSGGADAYVLKPFSTKKVNEILKTCALKRGTQELLQCIVLDDEELARDILETELKKLSAECLKVSSAEMLFDALGKAQPDILFLDIQMPEMDGHEILLKVKEKMPGLYVVMVSGNSDIENVKKAIELGANGFLVKPLNSNKLAECVDTYRNNKS